MKKEEMIALGVKEENFNQLREIWWNDVNIKAAEMVEKGYNKPVSNAGEKEGKSLPRSKEAATVSAIVAMLRLFDDISRLNFILETVNREYYYQEKEKARKEYETQVEELRQKMYKAKKPRQEKKKPMPEEVKAEQEAEAVQEETAVQEAQQEEEKAGECPEAAPGVG
jgi:hypothetical protein